MEFRRVGEALLRSQPTCLSALARPRQQRLGLLSNITAPGQRLGTARRSSTNPAVRQQEHSSPSSPSTADAPSNTTATRNSPSSSISDDLNNLLAFTTPTGSRASRPGSAESPSSAADAYAGYRGAARPRADVSSAIGRMVNPRGSPYGDSLGNLNIGGAPNKAAALTTPPDPATLPRLGPEVGRRIPIRNETGFDIGRALRQMESVCNYNNVRNDSFMQRYHERPGLKKKRLASYRWRKRFLTGFKTTVARVQYLKRQGW